jgi:hypothetical protein
LGSPTSPALWRTLVVALAVIACIQLAIELLGAPRQLTLGMRGEALFDGRRVLERGPTTFVVDALAPQSPLVGAGVRPGDRLRYDRPAQQFINWAAGDQLSLTVIRGDSQRRVDVMVMAAPSLPPYVEANYVIVTVARLLAVVIGLAIGWRRPELAALRALAATALLAPMVFPSSSPEAMHLPWLDLIGGVSSDIGFGVLVFFALNYPDDRPTGWRAALKRVYPWIFGLQLAAAIYYFGRQHVGYFEPLCWWLIKVSAVVNPALFFVGILLAWRAAPGEIRVRLQWILATLGAIMVTFVLGNLNRWVGSPIPAGQFDLISNVTFVVAEIGFIYAVFRHRIFDFGLAVNRALIFAIVGAILFGAIQLAHAVASEFLRVDDRNKAVLLSAILALAVYLSFNQLKKAVEKIVDRLFFRSWAAREDDLRLFVKESQLATEPGALDRLFVAAVDRFTGGAGCALFHRQTDGSYARRHSTLAGVPERVDANDDTVLALRAHGEALTPVSALPQTPSLNVPLALPMLHRGQLLAFALIGAAPGAAPYRPDQVAALQSAAHQVGFDFHAMRIEALEHLVAAERQAAATLRAQLDTAMSMARRDADA